MLHPLLEEIFAAGVAQMPDGTPAPLDSSISREECMLLDRAIGACGAVAGVEVGMAIGISTLCIANALQMNAGRSSARLVTVDPYQRSQWGGAGVYLVERAGLGAVVELIEESSQLALPALVQNGDRFGFALIDGWHTFDHTLVDFFFIDALLSPGGVVVIDDVGYPAIGAVVRFVLSNRDYEMIDSVQYRDQTPLALRSRRAFKRLLRPLARTDRDPSRAHESLFRRLDRAEMVALRKRSDDTRSFNHFERF